MKKLLLCLILTLGVLGLFGCKSSSGLDHGHEAAAPDEPGHGEKSLEQISDEDFLSFVDSYENHIYQSLYAINGEMYGRIISSSDSSENAVAVCTRHFTDNRYPQSINTVTECKVIYESDMLYGIHVKWQLTNNGNFDGQFEDNVISFKKDIADITVRNVIYDDTESYRICSNTEEQIKEVLLYLFHHAYLGRMILDYGILADGDAYRMTIYSFEVIFGDWGVKNEYRLLKDTIAVDKTNGDVHFEGSTVLKTVYR